MKQRWCLFSVGILLASAIAGLLGFNKGYETHRHADFERVQLAISSHSSTNFIPVVNAAKDLPAGTIISMSDMAEEQVATAKCPVGHVDSPYIAVGRTLRYGVIKGHFLALSDFGFSYPSPSPHTETKPPNTNGNQR